jgi:hypothetical protein
MAIIIDIKANTGNSVRSVNALSKAMQNLQSASSGAQSAMPGGGGRGGRRGPDPMYSQFQALKALNRVSGGKYQGNLRALAGQGFGNALAAAGQGVPGAAGKANAYASALAQKNPQSPVMRAVMSSRLGIGQGGFSAMPLVSQLLPALASAGPAGLAAAAALAAVAAAATVASKSLSIIGDMTDIKYGSMATGRSMGALSGLKAMGFDVSGDAHALQGMFDSSGAARAAGASVGINTVGGPFGNYNVGDKLADAIKRGIIDAPTQSRAERFAVATGTEKYLNLRDMSPAIRDQLLKGMSGADSPENRRLAADFHGQVGIAQNKFNDLMLKLGVVILPVVNDAMDKVTKGLDNFNSMIEASPLYQIYKHFNPDKPAEKKDTLKDAVDENTRALRQNTETLGGGQRAQGAIPKAAQSGAPIPNSWGYREAVHAGLRA